MSSNKKFTINDHDRQLFVENDEGWYHLQRRTRGSMRDFLKQYREEIDEAIRQMCGQ